MVNLKNDAISADQIPPPVLLLEALDWPLEKNLLNMRQWLWSRSGGEQRQAFRTVQEHYEFDLAVALIGKRVAEQIQQLGQQLKGHIDPAILGDCASWYASTSQEVFQRLKAREEQYPELFQTMQQHVLKQAIQASARERLEKLLADGVISRSVLEKLEDELESGGNS
jgi:hypothetical protein